MQTCRIALHTALREEEIRMSDLQTLLQPLTRMQLEDYVDIILVAMAIYMLLPILRRTGATRIVVVLLATVVISFLAEFLHLYTVHYLFSELLTVGLIAVVILFQPELRRTLDHLGSLRLQKLFSGEHQAQEMETVIAQTVMACEVMSQQKVGALIVFERDSKLDEYMKAGTAVDAQVSEQLIRNIFFPNASLHDGAMIIRSGRIASAGCVLPLSESVRLSADLGTRHRAGVGVSEVSDAVVVVVSEETGAISVAVGGMLKRHLAVQTLERLLHNELCREETEKEENLVLMLRQKLQKKGKDGSDEK